MDLKRVSKNREMTSCIIKIALSIMLFCFGIRNLTNFGIPVILLDEFGYLSNGAFLSGYDWSGVESFNAYYSYGYSIFIAIALKIFTNSIYAYRALIVFNSCLFVMCYWMADSCLRMLYPGHNKDLISLVAVVATCTPTIITNTHLAWAETLIVFYCWLSMYLLLKHLKTKQIRWIVGFVITLFLEYVTHQRSIGLLVSGIVVIAYLLISRRVKLRYAIVFVAILVAFYLAHKYLKTTIKSNLYKPIETDNTMSSTNDYSSMLPFLQQYHLLEGVWPETVYSFFGKIVSFLLSTFLLWGFGFCELVKDVFRKTVSSFKEKRLAYDDKSIFYVYVLLFNLAAFAITVITCIFSQRLDGLVYGRYIEWVQGIVAGIGLIKVLDGKNVRKNTFIICGILVILAKYETMYYKVHDISSFSWICSSVPELFYRISGESKNYLMLAVVVILVLYVLICLIQTYVSKNLSKYIVATIFCIIFLIVGNVVFLNVKGPHYRCQEIEHIQTIIDSDKKIKFAGDDQIVLWYAASLQFLNRDTEISYISKDVEKWDLNPSEGYYVISSYNDFENAEKYGEVAEMIYSNHYHINLYYVSK